MTIDDKCVVSIHYTLTGDSGDVIDSSTDGEPMNYLHGAGNIVPGLEQELQGKAVGDNVKVTVPPELGYGERHDELVQKVPRSAFGDAKELMPGMQFQGQTEDDQIQVVTVASVADDEVTVDANHPLAGEVLHFDVTVKSVREATETEVEHGHVH